MNNEVRESPVGWWVLEENTTVTVSPRLYPMARGGGSAAVTDTTPGQHAMAPVSLPSGGTQGRHWAADVAPVALLKVSRGQGPQELADTVPRLSPNRPAPSRWKREEEACNGKGREVQGHKGGWGAGATGGGRDVEG